MNRAEKTRQHLKNLQDRLRETQSLQSSKQAFFEAVRAIRSEVMGTLTKSLLVEGSDLKRLDALFEDIDTQRHESTGPNHVYWRGVEHGFNGAVAKMYEIQGKLASVPIPIRIQVLDLLKDRWLGVAGVLLALASLIIALMTLC
jgi:hypothetical protein